MARGTNQKLKLYYLVQIMLAKTDEEHSLTMPQNRYRSWENMILQRKEKVFIWILMI